MIKIIIQGPQGCGKTHILNVIEEALKKDYKLGLLTIYSGETEYESRSVPLEGQLADIQIFTTNLSLEGLQ
jgi:Ni2+-binding GTPase involved in maturation of urease and hydrogenase